MEYMVQSTEPLQKKLEGAYTYFGPIDPKQDLPGELIEEYKSIVHDMTCESALGDEGALRATLARMPDAQAHTLVSRLYALAVRVDEAYYKQLFERGSL